MKMVIVFNTRYGVLF